ncbi:MAG: helix-turn-helix domain-containing protein [Blastocatellia bacterium]
MSDFVFSEKEFCRRVGLSRVSVWRLRKAGKISYLQIGGSVKYTMRHVEEFLQAHERAAYKSEK